MSKTQLKMDQVAMVAVVSMLIVHVPLAAEVLTVSRPFAAPKGDYVTEQGRYHTFRIPGMIAAPDGTILVFAEGRRGDGSDPRHDENAPIDLVMRRSTDNGRTWEPLVVIDSGFRANGRRVDFGDPTPVLDVGTKTIFLLYGQWPDKAPNIVSYGQNPDSADSNHVVWVRSSTDNGRTWSERQQIVYPDEPKGTSDGLYWRQAEPGPGHGIQLQWQSDASRNGRLVVPAKRSGSKTPDGPATVAPFVYFSDDHGKSWQVGGVTPGPQGNEDEVIELTDGTLLLDARQNGGEHRRRHVSRDGGATWGPNTPESTRVAEVDASLLRYSAKREGHDKDRILFSAPRGRDGLNRNDLTVWTSYDEGKTFGGPVRIHAGFAAYSVLQRLADGSIGLVVETVNDEGARYGAITFYRFDLAELEP